MTSDSKWWLSWCAGLALGLCGPLSAQGLAGWTNFEAPPVRPIVCVEIDGADHLLVCNGPDAAVELYDTRGLRLVDRVRTGLTPVSVVWSPRERVLFTANRVGDSVSRIAVAGGPAGPRLRLDRTQWVGDTPSGLALAPDEQTLFVTLNDKGTLLWLDARTLAPAVPSTLSEFELLDSLTQPRQALRNPRAILRVGERLHVLGYRSGHSYLHDKGLWTLDFGQLRVRALGGLGTFRSNLRGDAQGRLWVVGGEARNDLPNEDRLRQAPTGFVRSMLYRIDDPGGAAPVVRARDLNTDRSGAPVVPNDSLAHPMDVALYAPGGAVQKLFVAAMHSDRIGVVVPTGDDPQQWVVRGFATQSKPGARSALAGPRGLAMKYGRPVLPGDPGDRLFALQPFDASLVEIDPVAERVLRVVPLARDPEPDRIVRGRAFFYGARFSGHGFVSCASCHLDGRTDALGWRLGPEGPGPLVPLRRDLLDGVTDPSVRSQTGYARDKGLLTTQTLQGLVTFETQRESQDFFTSRPYHWRGDRRDLFEFDQTYVSLQGMPNLAGPGERPRGLSEREMHELIDFLHSLHFEPNPAQPLTRRYSGRPSEPGQPGTGAQLGLELFHTREWRDPQTNAPDPVLAGRSCVQCHALPEGSNNRLTRTGFSTRLPMETPGLRGLLDKEVVVERDAQRIGTVRRGEFGLEHQGTLRSILDFNTFAFGHLVAPGREHEIHALTQFLREFDRGVAPSVGLAWTLVPADRRTSLPAALLDLCEGQVRAANASLAVLLLEDNTETGFVHDPVRDLYREEPGGRTTSRTALLQRLVAPSDRLVVQMTPLGAARHWADVHGTPAPLRGPAPSALRLEPMRPSTPWRDVPRLRANWVPGPESQPDAFHWSGVYEGTNIPVPTPPSLAAVRSLQHGLVQDGPGLGLSALRHEAPRRLRVSGEGLRPGARLVLLVPSDPQVPPQQATFAQLWPLVLDLHPTAERTARGRPIWETAAELEPLHAYALLLGGPVAPGVARAMAGDWSAAPPKGTFDPGLWNRYRVFVLNADGSFGDGGLQTLRLDG